MLVTLPKQDMKVKNSISESGGRTKDKAVQLHHSMNRNGQFLVSYQNMGFYPPT